MRRQGRTKAEGACTVKGSVCLELDDSVLRENEIRMDTLKQVVADMAKAIGPACEVVLHDPSKPNAALTALSGNVTGRTVGAPLTDLALRILRLGKTNGNLINYGSTTSSGKPLRSSTFIVRNSKREPVALLCFNFDLTLWSGLRDMANACCTVDTRVIEGTSGETFSLDVKDILTTTVSRALGSLGEPVHALKKKQRLEVVETLDEAGIFQIKGACQYVAAELGVSRFSLHNYIKEVRSK